MIITLDPGARDTLALHNSSPSPVQLGQLADVGQRMVGGLAPEGKGTPNRVHFAISYYPNSNPTPKP